MTPTHSIGGTRLQDKENALLPDTMEWFAETPVTLLKKFLQSVLPAIIKPLHSLWNQMIGFLYLVIGVVAIRPTWKHYQVMQSGKGEISDFAAMLCGGLFVMAGIGFGIHGFWKARRISRS